MTLFAVTILWLIAIVSVTPYVWRVPVLNQIVAWAAVQILRSEEMLEDLRARH